MYFKIFHHNVIDHNVLKFFCTSLYTKYLYYLYNCLQEEKFTGKRNWNFGSSPARNKIQNLAPGSARLDLSDCKTDPFN